MAQSVLVAVAAAAMAVLPLRAVLRLRGRGRPDLAPFRRAVLGLAAGELTIVSLLVLDRWAHGSLAAHMLQHLVIGDLVPLLLLLAVRGPLLVHLVSAAVLRSRRRGGLGRVFAACTRPAVAFGLWAGSLALWHLPAVYDRALESELLHPAEHASFFAGGLLVWWVLLDPARRRRLAGWRPTGYALAVLAVSGLLGNALILSYRPLYSAYADSANPLGLSALADQNLAGLLMMLEQLATLGVFAALSARRQLQIAPASLASERHPFAT
jgi:cytochrome c oxidase assembly factor CtaG